MVLVTALLGHISVARHKMRDACVCVCMYVCVTVFKFHDLLKTAGSR